MEPAARAVARWLETGDARPEFVVDGRRIEIVSHCAACDSQGPRVTSVTTGAALQAWVRSSLPDDAPLDVLLVGTKTTCEKNCCAFSDGDVSGPDDGVYLQNICFAGTTPPVLSRLEFQGAW